MQRAGIASRIVDARHTLVPPLATAFGIILSCCSIAAAAAMVHAPQPAPDNVILAQARPNLNTQAQIYFLRGLANVFSRGMDGMAAKLQSARLQPARDQPSRLAGSGRYHHRELSRRADARRSLLSAIRSAPMPRSGWPSDCRRNNVPVAYLATFDPTRTSSVPANVQHFANFYQNNGMGRAGDISGIETQEQGQSQSDHQPRHDPHQYRSVAATAAHRDREDSGGDGEVVESSI